jgi:hypothetical protein
MFMHAAGIKPDFYHKVQFDYLTRHQARDFLENVALLKWYALGTAPQVSDTDWELIYEVRIRK